MSVVLFVFHNRKLKYLFFFLIVTFDTLGSERVNMITFPTARCAALLPSACMINYLVYFSLYIGLSDKSFV